jgi:hypothetical protein
MWRTSWLASRHAPMRAGQTALSVRRYSIPGLKFDFGGDPEPPQLHIGEDSLHIPSLSDKPFPFQWLRDSCRCSQCIHPSNSQKTFLTTHVSEYDKPTETRFVKSRLHITWNSGHTSTYPTEFLTLHSKLTEGLPDIELNYSKDVKPIYWDKEAIESSQTLSGDYPELYTQLGLWNAIKQIRQYGLIFIVSCSCFSSLSTDIYE